MENSDSILVRGAREHNLKNVSVDIPRNQITVITGLSGSGKSSLAFDTIYAEGQRRYVDSLSTYARQFLDRFKKPVVDSISGLSPAIAIDQKSVGLSPRSTVGTVTEIYDYLRLLYAKVGVPHCPTHKIPVAAQLPSQIVDEIMRLPKDTRFLVLAPIYQGKKGEFLAEFQKWQRLGFAQAKVDGELIDLSNAKKLTKTKTHDIDLVIDKLLVKPEMKTRLAESINTAIGLANGRISIEIIPGYKRTTYSIKSACPICGFNFPELEPRLFSFNNPRGACPTCNGLGTIDIVEYFDERRGMTADGYATASIAKYHVSKKALHEDESEDDETVDELALANCPDCDGTRLREESRNILIGQRTITDLSALSAKRLLEFLASAKLPKQTESIQSRLDYLVRVGAGYLSLDRPTRTLSGGEAQRIRLATQVGSSLVGILYVLDEPSIGLHPRDHHRLLEILRDVRDLGNTILMVEHDEDTIRTADHIIDMGPRAGRLGGDIIAQGGPREIEKNPQSITGQFLAGKAAVPVPNTRRKGSGESLHLLGANGNNLKNVDLKVPLGTFTVVTGVSGSGKSTLIMDTLYRALRLHVNRTKLETAPYRSLEGFQNIDRVIHIDQSPIGRTPRSTPATYVGLFPLVRDLYASLPDSKVRGYGPGRFSFNVKGGRCEACQGGGMLRVEMHFMPDVFVECDICQGKRYNRETLAIKYKDKNISQVLDMPVGEAVEFFSNHTVIRRKLETMNRVGLDYITLGQSSTTLSGGEAQRVKLSRELSKRSTGRTLYILDEPTTGLHFADVEKLVHLLQELTDIGNTVLVIEHNMDVVKAADHVVDLGPEGGDLGGQIVAQGTPEEVAKEKASPTSAFLAAALGH